MLRCLCHVFSICVFAAVVAGCGSKGALVLPDKAPPPAPQPATPAPADTPAPSPPNTSKDSAHGSR